MKGIFQTISGRLDAVRIGELPERRYLLFDRENEPLVALAMEGLPYLNYGYWVDRRAIVGEMPFEIKLAIDVVPLAAHHPAIYETLENSGRILSNGNGMKVYRYRLYEKIGDMQSSIVSRSGAMYSAAFWGRRSFRRRSTRALC